MAGEGHDLTHLFCRKCRRGPWAGPVSENLLNELAKLAGGRVIDSLKPILGGQPAIIPQGDDFAGELYLLRNRLFRPALRSLKHDGGTFSRAPFNGTGMGQDFKNSSFPLC